LPFKDGAFRLAVDMQVREPGRVAIAGYPDGVAARFHVDGKVEGGDSNPRARADSGR
jgi:hypothetical protein